MTFNPTLAGFEALNAMSIEKGHHHWHADIGKLSIGYLFTQAHSSKILIFSSLVTFLKIFHLEMGFTLDAYKTSFCLNSVKTILECGSALKWKLWDPLGKSFKNYLTTHVQADI